MPLAGGDHARPGLKQSQINCLLWQDPSCEAGTWIDPDSLGGNEISSSPGNPAPVLSRVVSNNAKCQI